MSGALMNAVANSALTKNVPETATGIVVIQLNIIIIIKITLYTRKLHVNIRNYNNDSRAILQSKSL